MLEAYLGQWFQGDTTAVLQEIFIQTSIQKMWKKQPEGGWLSGFCENLAWHVWLSRCLIDFLMLACIPPVLFVQVSTSYRSI